MPVTTTKYRRARLRRTLATAVAAAVIGSLVSMAGLRAAMAADDDADDTFDTKFVRGILSGLGLKRDGDDPGINYHERSPLVVPPTRDLPPPESSAGTLRDPAWPKDSDVARRKAVKRAIRDTSGSETEDMRQLRPEELDRMRSGTARTATGATGQPGGAAPEQLKPNQLGFTGFKWSSVFNREGTVVPFVQEPPRTSLTEPPPGLRTPSPKYQYGNKGTLEPTREIGTDQAVGAK
jgi:hypothetical protein